MLKTPCILLLLLHLNSLLYAQSTSVLLKNCTLIDVKEGVARDKTDILIEDHLIKKIGSNLSPGNDSCEIIDIAGKYVVPGLIDMHSHLPGKGGQQFDTKAYLLLNLLCGITSIRSMRGQPHHLALRDSINQGLLQGPDLYLASAALVEDTVHTTIKDLKNIVAANKRAGFQYIKYLYSKHPEFYDSLSKYCHAYDIPLVGHGPAGGLSQVVKCRPWNVEHVEPFLAAYQKDSAQYYQMIATLAQEPFFVCPDIYWYYVAYDQLPLSTLLNKKGLEYIPRSLRERWKTETENYLSEQLTATKKDEFRQQQAKWGSNLTTLLRLLQQMNAAGVKLMISAGDGFYIIPGFSYFDELRLFKQAGISNKDILKAATINAAACLKDERHIGSIEENKTANLLIVEQNPLEDISNLEQVAYVIRKGKLLSKQTITKALDELQRKYK